MIPTWTNSPGYSHLNGSGQALADADGTDEGRLAERNFGKCSASPAHNAYAGPNIHARSPAAFAGLRPSCGLCASTLPSVVKAAPGIGHPDACDPRKYRRHRQQRARGWVAIRRRTTCVAALLVSDLNHGPGLVEPCPTGHDFLAATDEADGADFVGACVL